MSSMKTIGLAGAAILVLSGVLATLAQTAEEPPTELYVRTTPDGAKVFVDGKQVGTSPVLLEIAPGEHTITVLREGYDTKTSRVAVREGRIRRVVMELDKLPAAAPEANDDRAAWGEPVEGVQIRLWAEKKTWRVGEEVVLKVDCRNQGKRDLMLDERTGCFDVYVDSRCHSPDPNTIYLVWPAPLGPGQQYNGRPIGLGRYPGLELAPGEHTIRVVLKAVQNTVQPVEGAAGGTTVNKDELEAITQKIEKRRSQPPVVVSSNPIEIEIVAAEAATASGIAQAPMVPARKLFSASPGEGVGVLAVAFSPDGQTVAAVDEQSKVTLHDARSGRQLWGRNVLTPEEKRLLLYEERQGRIHTAAIAFSSDGYTLAVAADPVVRLYDSHGGRLLLALHDKRLLEQLAELDRPPATLSRERELLEAVPHAHGRVYSVAFSPDGKLVVTSGSHLIRADGSSVVDADVATQGKLKLWDAKTGELKRDLGEHYSAVRSAAFSPDGKTLASIGSHPPGWTSSVRLWDPQTGEVKSALSIRRGGLMEELVAFSPDGKLIAASTFFREADPYDPEEDLAGIPGRGLMVFGARTGEPLVARRPPGLVTSLSFSADSKTLATGVDGQGVTLWDTETLKMTGQIDLSGELPRNVSAPVRVAFSPTANLLAVGAEKGDKGGFVTVWDLGQVADDAAQGQVSAAARARTQLNAYSTALDVYRLDEGRYPTTDEGLRALWQPPGDAEAVSKWQGPYVKMEGSGPQDPWGNPIEYRQPGRLNPDSFDVFSPGPDGLPDTADDIGNWTPPPDSASDSAEVRKIMQAYTEEVWTDALAELEKLGGLEGAAGAEVQTKAQDMIQRVADAAFTRHLAPHRDMLAGYFLGQLPKAPPIDRSEWTDRSAEIPADVSEKAAEIHSVLWQPVAAARAYWMAAMVKTMGAEALGKTFMLQSLAPETSMVEDASLERPVIVTPMADGLFVVHLRRNNAGMYECAKIESLWARQMPASKAAPVYDLLPEDASPVERLLGTYRATVRRRVAPRLESMRIEEILREADAVAVEQLMPKRELLFEEAARRLAQLPQAEPIDRTEWQPVDDAPTREMVDSMGKDLSEAGGIAVAWDPIRMAQQVRMSVLTRSNGPAAMGIQSIIAAAAMGYCDAVADAEAAHPVIVNRTGDEITVVGLRHTDRGTYVLDSFERLARKK